MPTFQTGSPPPTSGKCENILNNTLKPPAPSPSPSSV